MPELITFTDKGIFVPAARVFIDPWSPVDKALTTHAHSDHARFGSKLYLAHRLTSAVLKYRLGADIKVQEVEYGEEFFINGLKFSYHPAGHLPGSAQIRIEHKGEICVVSGDYKLDDDGLSTPFDPIRCHSFVSESTFGLPVFRWKQQPDLLKDILAWWELNQQNGICSIITGYALGKAQRLVHMLGNNPIGPIFLHGAIFNTNQVLIDAGVPLPDIRKVDDSIAKELYRQALIIAPPSAMASPWLRRFHPYRIATASGWMALRGTRRRRAVDRGFTLSDHADWDQLNRAVQETGAQKIYVTHGYTASYARWLREKGLDAVEVSTRYTGELSEINETTDEESRSSHEENPEP